MPLSQEALASDAAILKAWSAEQSHDTFNRYLEAAGDDWTRKVLNGHQDPLDVLRYAQGVLAGLRIAQQIPENVAGWAKVAAENAKK